MRIFQPLRALAFAATFTCATALGAQDLLIAEDYSVAFLYELPSVCAGGALHGSAAGTLALNGSGTFLLSLSFTRNCPQLFGSGGSSVLGDSFTGNYELSSEGRLRLSFGGQSPPFVVEELQLTPDLEVLMSAPSELEDIDPSLAPMIGFGTRETSAASTALVAGEYAAVWISKYSQDNTSGGSAPPVVGSAEFGTFVFDGAGGGSRTLSSVEFTEAGQGPVFTTSGSGVGYTVGANGSFSIAGRGFGGVCPNGRAAFVLQQSGPNPPFTSQGTQSLGILIKLDDLPYLDRALDGHWVGAEYGIGRFYSLDPNQITTYSLEAELMANRRSGSILGSTVDRNVTPFGTSDVREGGFVAPQSVRTDGGVEFEPGSQAVLPFWLGIQRDLAVSVVIEDDFYVSAFLMLRVDGALAGTTRVISQVAGGYSELELDAGDDNAGNLYLVVGSVSGSYPGFEGVPINPDAYTSLTLSTLGSSGLLTGSFGVLNDRGRARAAFAVPPGTTGLAGIEFTHAGLVFDSLTGATELISNAVRTTVVP